MWLVYVFLFFSSLAFAGNSAGDNPAAMPDLPPMVPGSSVSEQKTPLDPGVQRQGILEFEFDPDGGAFIARVSDANGTQPLLADALELDAIDDTGKMVSLKADKLEKNVFRATLNLAEGEHNLIARVKRGEKVLDGQFMLGVGKAVTEGRFALVPPNPEVGRLSWLIAALIGVPLFLGLLIGLFVIVQKIINPQSVNSTAV